jgi:hypothetical protein
MGLGDWWRRVMNREDERTVERVEEEQNETLDERRHSSSDVTGLEDDEFAARQYHEPNVEDTEEFAEDS